MKIKIILNLILLTLMGFIPAAHSNIIKNICIHKINDIFDSHSGFAKKSKNNRGF